MYLMINSEFFKLYFQLIIRLLLFMQIRALTSTTKGIKSQHTFLPILILFLRTPQGVHFLIRIFAILLIVIYYIKRFNSLKIFFVYISLHNLKNIKIHR